MDIIYDLSDEIEAIEDISLLAEGLKLLQYDYLGGHGSRGYGKIKFRNLDVKVVVGETSEGLEKEIRDILKGV